MQGNDEHVELKRLIEQNERLIKENNELLKKIRRNSSWSFWLQVVWYTVLIGLPFAIYFYFVEPYFEALGADYETFKEGIQEIPGFKGLDAVFNGTEE